jgi:protein SCO1/2
MMAMALATFSHAQAASSQSRYGANYFPNAPLITQDGKTVHFYDDLLKGKMVAVDLIYTSCHFSCPLETARMAQVQKLLGDRVGKDIFFYSISIDPARDTPAQLKAYAKKYHAGPGWLFLTGKKQDIELISKKLGLYTDTDINQDGHISSLMLGDEPNGQWVRQSAVDNPRFLFNAITDLLNHGQTHGKVGTGRSYAEVGEMHVDRGQYLFATRCIACHTIGHGDKIGPDLMGVTNVRKRDWLTRFIATPDQVMAAKDPVALALFKRYNKVQMPNLQLGREDVRLLIEYMQTQSEAASTQNSSSARTSAGNTGSSR